MQGTVVYSVRVSFIILVVLALNSTVKVSAAELEVTGYSTLLGTYTDSSLGKTYDDSFAEKYLNFSHHSRAGIQFNSKINEDFDFSLTLLMQGGDDYQAKADWFYATYAASEDLNFRFGRLKVPFYMVSNYIDIGNAYPWVAPPQEVYSTNLIKSADGIELVYDVLSSGGTNFLFEFYIGTSNTQDVISPAIVGDKVVNPPANPKYKLGDKVLFDAENMIGFEALISTGSVTFRTGYYTALIVADQFNIAGERTSVASVGIIIDWNNFVLYSEFVSRDSNDKADVLFADQKANYVTIGYRIGKLLTYFNSAKLDGGVNPSIHSLRQTSVGGGFRYEINDSTDFKLQLTKVTPTSVFGDTGAFGLYDEDTKGETANVYAMSIDILF